MAFLDLNERLYYWKKWKKFFQLKNTEDKFFDHFEQKYGRTKSIYFYNKQYFD